MVIMPPATRDVAKVVNPDFNLIPGFGKPIPQHKRPNDAALQMLRSKNLSGLSTVPLPQNKLLSHCANCIVKLRIMHDQLWPSDSDPSIMNQIMAGVLVNQLAAMFPHANIVPQDFPEAHVMAVLDAFCYARDDNVPASGITDPIFRQLAQCIDKLLKLKGEAASSTDRRGSIRPKWPGYYLYQWDALRLPRLMMQARQVFSNDPQYFSTQVPEVVTSSVWKKRAATSQSDEERTVRAFVLRQKSIRDAVMQSGSLRSRPSASNSAARSVTKRQKDGEGVAVVIHAVDNNDEHELQHKMPFSITRSMSKNIAAMRLATAVEEMLDDSAVTDDGTLFHLGEEEDVAALHAIEEEVEELVTIPEVVEQGVEAVARSDEHPSQIGSPLQPASANQMLQSIETSPEDEGRNSTSSEQMPPVVHGDEPVSSNHTLPEDREDTIAYTAEGLLGPQLSVQPGSDVQDHVEDVDVEADAIELDMQRLSLERRGRADQTRMETWGSMMHYHDQQRTTLTMALEKQSAALAKHSAALEKQTAALAKNGAIVAAAQEEDRLLWRQNFGRDDNQE